MNKAVINIHIQDLGGHKFLIHLDKYQGAQLLDHMLRVCFFVRKCQIVTQSGCTILQYHLQ